MADVGIGGILECRRIEMSEMSIDEGRNRVLDGVTYPDKKTDRGEHIRLARERAIEATSGVSDNRGSMASAVPSAIRTVEIRPPSLRDETTIVVRLAVVIAALVGFYLASTVWDTSSGIPRATNLLPYQVLMRDRPAAEQRMFRELQEGLLEAERLNSSTGNWPEPAALAADGIPPFASDPTAKGAAHIWTVLKRGTYINYRGTPATAGAPAWLLLIQEPTPDAPPDPSPEDEEHHRLSSTVMLHVSVWVHAGGATPGSSLALVRTPQAEGWTQLRAGPLTTSFTPVAPTPSAGPKRP